MKPSRAIFGLALLAPLTARVRAADAPPDLRFGVMTHFAQGWDPAAIPALAREDIPTVRDELYWDAVEPQRGRWSFPARYDRYLADLRGAGIAPLLILDFANRNYDGGATPYTAAGIAGYAGYAAAVLQHYGRQIGAVEIWNEYNGSFCAGPATQDRAATYLRTLHAAYARIKAVRPDVTVVGGATAGVPRPYWEKLLAGGALADLDVLSIHPYHYDSPPEGLEDDVAGLQDLVRRHNGGRTKPIWVTEIGWASQGGASPGDLAMDEDTQAKFLVRAYALLLSAGVERVYWYEFRDDQGLKMGLVRGDAGGTPKPAERALANLIRQLRGAQLVRREPTARGLYSVLFRRPNGEEVRVLWSLAPRTLLVRGLAGAVDLLGRPVVLTPELLLGDSPLFVTGPLAGLPRPEPSAETLLTDSRRDFSSTQGGHGWFYGTFTDAGLVFTPLPKFIVTDWSEEWTGGFPYVAVSDRSQHPSAAGDQAYLAVRRWISDRAGPVHLVGSFQCGPQGDGVGVSLLVGGECLFRVLLGGGSPVRKDFDLVKTVRAGTPIDFAVDPGPDWNIDYDATSLAVTISAPDAAPKP